MTKLNMITSITAALLIAGAASAQQVGVVGLYQNGATFDEAAATELGCTVQRSGTIADMKGRLDVPLTQPDQFVVLACKQPIMVDNERRSAVEMLSEGGEVIALFEGALMDFELPAIANDASGRQYILKVGYYNNADVNARNAESMALNANAQQRGGAFTTESFLQVHSASGLATPDEVVVLYYETPEAGEKFRNNNQDLLEVVGAFNKVHLDGFSYLIGMASE